MFLEKKKSPTSTNTCVVSKETVFSLDK